MGSNDYQRSEQEWLEVCDRITGGHIPNGEGKWGGPRATYWEGIGIPRLFLVPPKPGDEVLDFGCGNGRLAIALLEYDVRYVGLDPFQPSIDFCRFAFDPWRDRYTFNILPIKTGWTPQFQTEPIDMRIPYGDCTFDWIAVLSVFTHLSTEPVARHYLGELVRVLKPGGVLWTTWFGSPPNELTGEFGRTVYSEDFIRKAIGDAGLKWIGDHGGTTTVQHDQWQVWTRKYQESD